MANLYVRSTDGSDADNGTTWALAKATLVGALAVASAGDTIWISQAHAETQASLMTLTSPGTAASPCRILCGNDAAEPPTSLAATATITVSTNAAFSIAGFAYYYGITFVCAGNFVLASSASPHLQRFDTCEFSMTRVTAVTSTIGVPSAAADDQIVEFINTNLRFAATGNTWSVRGCPFKWKGGTIVGATIPTVLFTNGNGTGAWADFINLDLSPLGSGKTLVTVTNATWQTYIFQDCKLGSSVTLVGGTHSGIGGSVVEFINCDSGDTNYKYTKACYQGDITQETTIVRSSGASDGTTSFSRKMVSSANTKFYAPLESTTIAVWNETTGSSLTATVEVVTDNVTLNDDECWLEIDYSSDASTPLYSLGSDRATNVLTSGAAQTSSSVTWTTTGLTTPVKQKLQVTFTPQNKGLVKGRVMLAKASTTMYFCPKMEVA